MGPLTPIDGEWVPLASGVPAALLRYLAVHDVVEDDDEAWSVVELNLNRHCRIGKNIYISGGFYGRLEDEPHTFR
jgi:hypothetical protein